MQKKTIIPLWLILFIAFPINNILAEKTTPQETSRDWLKIYYNSNGINRINAHLTSDLDSIEYKVHTIEGTDSIVKEMHIVAHNEDPLILPLDSIMSIKFGGNIPTVYIDTEIYVEEIPDKENYLNATFRYVPYDGENEYIEQNVSVKGRGNSSWTFPKKPLRLKFEKKQSIGELNKAKSFVLLSNYIDNTLMRNAVAMKIAELIDLPFSNKIVPVNLVLNGKQKGNYMLTNKVGINSGSIDIDEKEGILWEFDTNFDEEFRFRSEPFNLPCMVKDPDFHEITDNTPNQIEEIFNYWKADLESALRKVEEGNWRESFDEEQFIKYFIVQSLVLNTEIEFPKSFYAYKENKNGKYKLGPCWDYDWSFGYHHNIDRGVIYRNCGSYEFLINIFEDQSFLKSFRESFTKFCDEHLDEIMSFIDDHAALIRDSAMADALIWPAEHFNEKFEHAERNTNHFDDNVKELKDWIVNRIEIVKNSPNCALY